MSAKHYSNRHSYSHTVRASIWDSPNARYAQNVYTCTILVMVAKLSCKADIANFHHYLHSIAESASHSLLLAVAHLWTQASGRQKAACRSSICFQKLLKGALVIAEGGAPHSCWHQLLGQKCFLGMLELTWSVFSMLNHTSALFK